MSGAFDEGIQEDIAAKKYLKAADQFTYHCLFIGPSRRLCEALIKGDAPGAILNCGFLMLETLPWLKVDGRSVLSKFKHARPDVKPNKNLSKTNGKPSGTTKPGPQQRTVDTTTPSLEQQARNIKHLMNRDKNTVKVGTPSREIQYDLAGRAHRGVPTPHKQYSNRNVNRKGEVHFNKDKRTVEPFDQQDIRTVKEALKRREKKDNKEQSATTKDNKEQPTTKDHKVMLTKIARLKKEMTGSKI